MRSLSLLTASLIVASLAAPALAAPAPAAPAPAVTCADINGAIASLTRKSAPDIGLGFWATTPQRTADAEAKGDAKLSGMPAAERADTLARLRKAAADRGCKSV